MINKVTLIGNLGKDPEIRHFENGGKVTQFSLATNENYQDKNGEWHTRTEWHRVTCWGPMAERAEKQLKKGGLTYIEGKISSRKWQDKEGIERTSVDIVANTFRSLERRETSEGHQSAQVKPAPTPVNVTSTPTPVVVTPPPTTPPTEEDLPF